MNIFEKIRQQLKSSYDASTQDEMAEISGVSQPSIGRYLSSPEYVKKMQLETFFRLFPDADIIFKKSSIGSSRARINFILDNLSSDDMSKALAILQAAFPEYK